MRSLGSVIHMGLQLQIFSVVYTASWKNTKTRENFTF